VSMAVGLFAESIYASCFFSMFIAVGFIPFMVSASLTGGKKDSRAAGMAGIAFAAVYAAIIFLVYFAELTTVRMNHSLSSEALSIISYGNQGSLFFNYDLLGYGFMGLSAFLVGFTVEPKDKKDRVFRAMLWINGAFFVSGLIVPLFPVFSGGSSVLVGTVILEIWCAFYLPLCALGYRYIGKSGTGI